MRTVCTGGLLALLLAGCGGGGGDRGAGGPVPPGGVDPGTPRPTCLDQARGAALPACLAGVYRAESVHQGPVGWSEWVVGADGSVQVSGEEVLSFAATDLLTATLRRTSVREQWLDLRWRAPMGTELEQSWGLQDGVLWDLGYVQDGAWRWVTVQPLRATRLRHPQGQIGNGWSASVAGRLQVLSVQASLGDSWATAQAGLQLVVGDGPESAYTQRWQLNVAQPLPAGAALADLPRDYACTPGDETVTVTWRSAELGVLQAGGAGSGRCVITLEVIEYLPSGEVDYVDGHVVVEFPHPRGEAPVRSLDGFFRLDPQ